MDGRTITADELLEHLLRRGQSTRHLTALAGPPASGKTTLCTQLAEQLNRLTPHSAAVVGLDGFHLDDRVLESRGDRDRKGAPQTFDVAGLGHLLSRLRSNQEDEIAVPVFDRELEIARNAASIIPRQTQHILIEGNYLLLDRSPWDSLRKNFDTTVFLTTSEDMLVERLNQRWKHLSPALALQKIDCNDLVNAKLVLEQSRRAEFLIHSGS